MYCTHCGKTIPEEAKFCTECGAPASAPVGATPAPEASPADGWGAFLDSLGSELLDVKAVTPDRFELAGERKIKALLSRTTVRYQAIAGVDRTTRTIEWWEKLTESSFGFAPESFGVSAETRKQKGTAVEIRKTVQTPGGNYAYQYGDLRSVVENEARRLGWTFKVTTRRP